LNQTKEEKGNVRSMGNMLLRKLAESGLILFIILLALFFTVKSEHFLSIKNFLNIFQAVSVLGITAAGMMMIIVSGGIDLSAGSTIAFIGCVQTEIVVRLGVPWYLGILLGLAIGMLCGLFNGFIVTYWKYQPFIATLGTMNVIRGLAYVISSGQSTFLDSKPLEWFGLGRMFGVIPVPVVLLLISFLVVWFIMHYTVFGRYVYSIGGNQEAARLAGISVKLYTMLLYVGTGFLAAVSGLVLLGLSGSSVPSAGENYGMDIVTAVILGGASLKGGKGSIVLTFLGVLTIGIMNNGMTLISVPQYWQIFAKGALLLFAVGLDQIKERVSAG
jgi:ribose transport system permease protein